MERYFKAIEKIRELEAEVQRRAQTEGELREQLKEAQPFITNDEKYVDFVKKIADTKSKFAKEARDILNSNEA